MSEHAAGEAATDGLVTDARTPIHWRPEPARDGGASVVTEPLRARDTSPGDPTTKGGNQMAKKKKDKKKKGKKGKKK